MTEPAAAPSGRGAGNNAVSSAAAELRGRTAACHRDTEAAYARFDLTDRRAYTLFLQAHLRALTAAERALATTPGLPLWQPRRALLQDDLNVLGALIPTALPFPAVLDTGRGWGVLYVLEGSQIGAEILSKRVQQDQPHSYLTATHGPGGWRTFCAALGAGLGSGDKAMLERAAAGAVACFGLFAAAARSRDLAGLSGDEVLAGRQRNSLRAVPLEMHQYRSDSHGTADAGASEPGGGYRLRPDDATAAARRAADSCRCRRVDSCATGDQAGF